MTTKPTHRGTMCGVDLSIQYLRDVRGGGGVKVKTTEALASALAPEAEHGTASGRAVHSRGANNTQRKGQQGREKSCKQIASKKDGWRQRG